MKKLVTILVALLGTYGSYAKPHSNMLDANDSAIQRVEVLSSSVNALLEKMSMRFTNDDSDVIYSYQSENASLTYTQGKTVCKLSNVLYQIYDTSEVNPDYFLVIITTSGKTTQYFGSLEEYDDNAYFQSKNISNQDIEKFISNLENLKRFLENIMNNKTAYRKRRLFLNYVVI